MGSEKGFINIIFFPASESNDIDEADKSNGEVNPELYSDT